MKQKNGATMVATLGSMTAAMNAQRALAAGAVRSEITRAEGSPAGCGYGVRFPAMQYGNVRTILAAARISVRRYTQGD